MKYSWAEFSARLRYLWPLRVPILSGAVLFTLPYIAFSDGADEFLSGLFDPVEPRAVALITTLAMLNAWTIVIITCLVASYGSERFDLVKLRYQLMPNRWIWLGSLVLAIPVVFTTIRYGSESPDNTVARLSFWAAAGAAAAVVLFGIATFISDRFRVTGTRMKQRGLGRRLFEWWLAFLKRHPSLGKGFLAEDGSGLAPGHGFAFGLSMASLLAYIGVGYLTRNIHRPGIASTLSYVLLLQLVLTWLSGFAAFVLDRSRAPLFAFLLIWVVVVNTVIDPACSTDHVYRTTIFTQAPDRLTPNELLGGTGPIVVAASGGGIQAAAWTAEVLSELDRIDGFRANLRLISSVSGGSVGTMNVLASWTTCGLPREQVENDALAKEPFEPEAAASESSLHAVGWGLVYKDFPRTFLPFFSSPFVDRGSVLEDAWKREPRLQRKYPENGPGALLSSWRPQKAGDCPAVIYNAMAAETGEPMLFSTATLPPSLKMFDFYERYPGRDVPVTTAARLSAGFPFVSPASRADADDTVHRYTHIVDGGYFDNYGVSTLAAVVHHGLASTAVPSPAPRALVIEFCDSAKCRGEQPDGKLTQGAVDDKSWTYQLTAPLSAVIAMRSAAQRVNNRSALRLLKDYWLERGVCIESVPVPFKPAGAPMSWHMTVKEKKAVISEWNKVQAATAQAVSDFIAGKPATAEGAACYDEVKRRQQAASRQAAY